VEPAQHNSATMHPHPCYLQVKLSQKQSNMFQMLYYSDYIIQTTTIYTKEYLLTPILARSYYMCGPPLLPVLLLYAATCCIATWA